MRGQQDVPAILLGRVLTPAGPYRVGMVLSVGYLDPAIGRLLAHELCDVARCVDAALVPEAFSIECVTSAEPYAAGEILTLSFIDPSIARIHPQPRSTLGADGSHAVPMGGSNAPDMQANARSQTNLESAIAPASPPKNDTETQRRTERDASRSDAGRPNAAEAVTGSDARLSVRIANFTYPAIAPSIDAGASLSDVTERTEEAPTTDIETGIRIRAGVRTSCRWDGDRIGRFTQVVERLLAIDRLGWYRHALVMRLFIPDEIACGDATADLAAARSLQDLRGAATEALGRPLLAAYMPSFSVTAEWLDSLDTPTTARAVSTLRAIVVPFCEQGGPASRILDSERTIGTITHAELASTSSQSIEAVLPLFIPTRSADMLLDERLTRYRRTLLDVFGQTADTPDAVRLGTMAQANRPLDDQLALVVEAFANRLVSIAAD